MRVISERKPQRVDESFSADPSHSVICIRVMADTGPNFLFFRNPIEPQHHCSFTDDNFANEDSIADEILIITGSYL